MAYYVDITLCFSRTSLIVSRQGECFQTYLTCLSFWMKSSVIQFFKHLSNMITGEVVIRQALSELDVWEVEAKFSFVGHQASTGEEVPLIKDWKDILNKASCCQLK